MTFISFYHLVMDTQDSTTLEELSLSLQSKPNKEVLWSIPTSDIKGFGPSPDFSDLTELVSIDDECFLVNEPFQSFSLRLLQITGQEPIETWSVHKSQDKEVTIRTYNN